MKIQEADAKKLLLAQGLPVPAWEVARSPAEHVPYCTDEIEGTRHAHRGAADACSA